MQLLCQLVRNIFNVKKQQGERLLISAPDTKIYNVKITDTLIKSYFLLNL